MYGKAFIYSMTRKNPDAQPVIVTIARFGSNNDIEVITPDGIRCTAIFNPFVGYMYADDVYGIITED